MMHYFIVQRGQFYQIIYVIIIYNTKKILRGLDDDVFRVRRLVDDRQ